jgi:exonuclease VII small subunit
MIRQIGSHYQEPSNSALEERVHHLESQVATLTDALLVLARGLEDGPMAEPGDRTMAEAARQAHDLLLAAQVPSAAEKDAGDRG